MAIQRLILALLFLLFVPSCTTHASPPTNPHALVGLSANKDSNLRVDVIGEGTGSGAVISSSGHILTACHVACDSDRIGIVLDEGGPYPFVYEAKLVAADKDWDLAVVKIDRRFSSPARLADSKIVESGLAVYSLGYPMDFGQIAARGTIAKTGYHLELGRRDRADLYDMLLIELQTGPGHSGGPVYASATGEMVGIMHGYMRTGRGGNVIITFTFVSPISKIRSFLDDYKIPYNE